MKKTKKALVMFAACAAVLSGAFGLAACNKDDGGGSGDTPHAHVWSAWSVSQQPTADGAGKATRTCSGEGDCDAAASDKEYTLPALNETDYVKGEDSANCAHGGSVKYTYDKDGVNVEITVDTQANGNHDYRDYAVESAEGHHQVCANNPNHITETEAHDTEGEDGACSKCGYEASVPVTLTVGDTPLNKLTENGATAYLDGLEEGHIYKLSSNSDKVTFFAGVERGAELTFEYSATLYNSVTLASSEGTLRDVTVTLEDLGLPIPEFDGETLVVGETKNFEAGFEYAYYEIEITESGTYAVTVGGAASADVEVSLGADFDFELNEVSGIIEPEEGKYSLEAGTYYISVASNKTDGGGNYETVSGTLTVAHAHTLIHTPRVDATCTESGVRENWECEECGKIYADENCETVLDRVTIPTYGHKLTHTAAINDYNGNPVTVEFWDCSACGDRFGDADGERTISNVAANPAGLSIADVLNSSIASATGSAAVTPSDTTQSYVVDVNNAAGAEVSLSLGATLNFDRVGTYEIYAVNLYSDEAMSFFTNRCQFTAADGTRVILFKGTEVNEAASGFVTATKATISGKVCVTKISIDIDETRVGGVAQLVIKNATGAKILPAGENANVMLVSNFIAGEGLYVGSNSSVSFENEAAATEGVKSKFTAVTEGYYRISVSGSEFAVVELVNDDGTTTQVISVTEDITKYLFVAKADESFVFRMTVDTAAVLYSPSKPDGYGVTYPENYTVTIEKFDLPTIEADGAPLTESLSSGYYEMEFQASVDAAGTYYLTLSGSNMILRNYYNVYVNGVKLSAMLQAQAEYSKLSILCLAIELEEGINTIKLENAMPQNSSAPNVNIALVSVNPSEQSE